MDRVKYGTGGNQKYMHGLKSMARAIEVESAT
jgi:hypothetical protein